MVIGTFQRKHALTVSLTQHARQRLSSARFESRAFFLSRCSTARYWFVRLSHFATNACTRALAKRSLATRARASGKSWQDTGQCARYKWEVVERSDERYSLTADPVATSASQCRERRRSSRSHSTSTGCPWQRLLKEGTVPRTPHFLHVLFALCSLSLFPRKSSLSQHPILCPLLPEALLSPSSRTQHSLLIVPDPTKPV